MGARAAMVLVLPQRVAAAANTKLSGWRSPKRMALELAYSLDWRQTETISTSKVSIFKRQLNDRPKRGLNYLAQLQWWPVR